jgi:membrane protease YdiL (CAAX protease family)
VERRRTYPQLPTRQGLVFGILFGVGVGAGGLGLYALLRDTHLLQSAPAKLTAKVQEFGLTTPALYILFAAGLSAVHSLLEEYYWRWFVFGRLRKLVRVPWAIGVSSVAFMAHHVIDLIVFFPGRFWTVVVPLAAAVAVGGAIWAWLYDRTGSIYAPWISHGLIDVAIMVAGYDMVFGLASGRG